MKLSCAWLRQFLPSLDASSEQIAETLTMRGLEVDSIEPVAQAFTGVVIGEITSIQPHPDADRLQVCQVNVGKGEVLTIVCGARNARENLKVAVALVGARLANEFEIKMTEIRGQVSCGMLCSEQELGLAEKSSGILELDDNAKIGMGLREHCNLEDEVLDVELTPNRGDCASMLGVARELQAAYSIPLNMPVINEIAAVLKEQVPVQVQEPSLAPLFMTQVVSGADFTAPLPIVWRERLRRAGLRSVHPVVDILNIVMLEYGAPMHAYDRDQLDGPLQVRYAKDSEQATLLDGQLYTLSAHDLVVCDNKQILALAGVMGAQKAEVTSSTKNIVLEAAYFDPMTIARSARRHGIMSEASYRFERGVDFDIQGLALQNAVSMLSEYAQVEVGPCCMQKSQSDLPICKAIKLRTSQIIRVLGFEIENQDVEKIFESLGLELTVHSSGWEATPPSWRFDLNQECDLLEELQRSYRVDQLPVVPLRWQQQIKLVDPVLEALPRMKRLLADFGYHEAISYSFISTELGRLFNPEYTLKELVNPLTKDQNVMRASLWPGLIQAAKYNLNRQQKQIRLFEMGACFIPQPDGDYQQRNHCAAVIGGLREPEQWSLELSSVDFYDIKSALEALLALYVPFSDRLAISYDFFAKGKHSALQPGQTAVVSCADVHLGFIGKLHPELIEKMGMKSRDCELYVFEIDLDRLPAASFTKYKEFSRFPSMRRDIALTVPLELEVKTLLSEMTQLSDHLLDSTQLCITPFDQYQGAHVPDGRKSLALGLTFYSTSRTLVDREINTFIQKVVEELQGTLGVQLRE